MIYGDIIRDYYRVRNNALIIRNKCPILEGETLTNTAPLHDNFETLRGLLRLFSVIGSIHIRGYGLSIGTVIGRVTLIHRMSE